MAKRYMASTGTGTEASPYRAAVADVPQTNTIAEV